MRLEVLYRICALYGYNLQVCSFALCDHPHVSYWLIPGYQVVNDDRKLTHVMCETISEVPEKVLAALEKLPRIEHIRMVVGQ